MRVMEAMAAAVRRGRHGGACDWKFMGPSAGGGGEQRADETTAAEAAAGSEQGANEAREYGSAGGVAGAMGAGGIANAQLDLIPRAVSAFAAHREVTCVRDVARDVARALLRLS